MFTTCAVVLQDANLLAVVLSFLPARTTLIARMVARFWLETAKRPLVCAALNEIALRRARMHSDAYVVFRNERTTRFKEIYAARADQPSAVDWLMRSYENGMCSAVFDELGGFRKFVIAAIKSFLDHGLTRLLIVAQPSALRDWARMLRAAAVSCVTTDQAELTAQHDPAQRTPAVLLRTPLQVEAELERLARKGPMANSAVANSIFGALYWHYTVFDASPMRLHESQQVALSHRFKMQQHTYTQATSVYVILSASPPPTQLHMLGPLLQLLYRPGTSSPLTSHAAAHADPLYRQLLEVVDRFCMGDAETRRWALKDYLPSEVAYLVRPCLLHVHTPAAPKGA